jgi:hypothetical protein
MSRTITVSWHENAIDRAIERVRAITCAEDVDTDAVFLVGEKPLSWMDLACLLDLGRHAVSTLENPDSPAGAPEGSHQTEPPAGEPNWKAIAIKLGQRESDWQLLNTDEAEALRVEVDAVWDREAIAEDTKQERMSDEARGGEA